MVNSKEQHTVDTTFCDGRKSDCEGLKRMPCVGRLRAVKEVATDAVLQGNRRGGIDAANFGGNNTGGGRTRRREGLRLRCMST